MDEKLVERLFEFEVWSNFSMKFCLTLLSVEENFPKGNHVEFGAETIKYLWEGIQEIKSVVKGNNVVV